jgi:HNH endonuclease/AP2 domain
VDKSDITADWIKNVLEYNPETGFFFWKQRFGRRGVPGKRAGTIDFNGYMVVTINGKRFKGHRLAWLVMTGNWPVLAVDHINGDRSDNRFENLREANCSENQHNRRLQRNNKSGYQGVAWDSHAGKWRAGIRADGRGINLGGYDTPQEAHTAYLRAKAQLHPFNPVPRNA